MKCILIIIVNFFISSICLGQRPPITQAVYEQWPKLGLPVLSNNGQYVSYSISYEDIISSSRPTHVKLVSTDLKWQKEFSGMGANVVFSGNSQYAFIKFSNDSLAIIKLGTANIEWIPQVSFSSPVGSNMIALRLKRKPDELIVRTLGTEKETAFQNVEQESLSKDERYMVLVCSDKAASNPQVLIKWVELSTMRSMNVWEGTNVSDICWSYNQQTIVFIENKDEKKTIWLYEAGSDKAKKIADAESIENNKYTIANIWRFSKDGSRLYIKVKPRFEKKPDPDAVQLDIWTYKDANTQTSQLNALNVVGMETWTYGFSSRKFTRLETYEGGCLQGVEIPENGNEDWAKFSGYRMVPGGNFENFSTLVSTIDGRRINMNMKQIDGRFSPQGKYYVFFDPDSKQFISYEMATGTTRYITKNINTVLKEMSGTNAYARGEIVGWLENDEGVLLSDQFDIWVVDMAGSKSPQNLTSGYGKKNNIMFFFMLTRGEWHHMDKVYSKGDKIILTAFNPKTKENGFYKLEIGKNTDPEKLIMGPYAFSLVGIHTTLNQAKFEPSKARNAEVYVVQRQTASEYPNYFITKDFKTFTRLTDLQPEKNYNWLTTELHEWKTKEGVTLQGILYKPQDFDPNKKYPVIFFYYSKKSDNLNVYIYPEPSVGDLNIEWYASNGYLVFTPDMYYADGNLYESCLSGLESAAKYLSNFSYVDGKKMGVIGHSWGGFQTNYIVTHSTMFAAACSGAGIADFVSHYNSTSHGGIIKSIDYDEVGSRGPKKTPWEDPGWYMQNSPIMNADKVTTPLLLFETSVDGACPYYNGMELYYALRRLGKKVWVLEYNDGNHVVQGKSSLDFDIRLQQFFNHYLKDAPPPKWMTEGRPAYLKGIDERLELDYSGKKP